MKVFLWVITIVSVFLLVLNLPALKFLQDKVFNDLRWPILIFYIGAAIGILFITAYMLDNFRQSQPWLWAALMVACAFYLTYAKLNPDPPNRDYEGINQGLKNLGKDPLTPPPGGRAINSAVLELFLAAQGIVGGVRSSKK